MVDPAADAGSPWPRRLIVALGDRGRRAIAIGLQLSGGFPESWVVDVAAKFKAFNDWVIANQRPSSLFVNILDPLQERDQGRLYDQVSCVLDAHDLARGGRAAAAIAGVVAGWRIAVLAACGFIVHGRARAVGSEHRDPGADAVRRASSRC